MRCVFKFDAGVAAFGGNSIGTGYHLRDGLVTYEGNEKQGASDEQSHYFNSLFFGAGAASVFTVPLMIRSVEVPLSKFTLIDFWKNPGRPSVP